jgi:hypothetical protein
MQLLVLHTNTDTDTKKNIAGKHFLHIKMPRFLQSLTLLRG